MKRLTIDHVLKMHNDLIKETGGSHGIRDYGLGIYNMLRIQVQVVINQIEV